MKVTQNNINNDNTMEVQTGPKLRNIHDEAEVPEEKPAGADIRLKLGTAAIFALILFVGIKGAITKSSLNSQIDEQQKLYNEAYAEALLYGITEDEDGDLVVPDTQVSVNISDIEWASTKERDDKVIAEFTKLLLNWEDHTGYEKVRQTLINDWGFTENSDLMKTFMAKTDGELEASMKLVGDPKPFVLTTDGKTTSYFLICKVRNTLPGEYTGEKRFATGMVGIRITINEDDTISNVTAQTLSLS